MIEVILSGGLGNQMFQYAAARSLSLRLDCGFVADLYTFGKPTKATSRKYELDIFVHNPAIVSKKKNKLFTGIFECLRHNRIGRRIVKLMGIYNEPGSSVYSEQFMFLERNSTLIGYFQNEKYFKRYESQIRSDFTFKKNLQGINKEIERRISTCNSVSIHVRRGDYLKTNSNLSVLDLDYYHRAMDYITERVSNPVFFIFSDDIEWVKNNLDMSNHEFVYVDHNKEDMSYIDMQLISSCKHNIIANSTFSWWGAWLNNNRYKIVIAPSVWYRGNTQEKYPDGFIPDGWTLK